MLRRRDILRRGGLVGFVGLSGCLSSLTGGGNEFAPAVEAFNRGIDEAAEARSTMEQARTRYQSEEYGQAAREYTTAGDRFDAAAAEFRTARDDASGKCTAITDPATRQFRRALAFVEACSAWSEAATNHTTNSAQAATRAAERARLWDQRAGQYETEAKLDPGRIRC